MGISAKKLKGNKVSAILGGKEYFLKFNLNALAHLEEQYGDINDALESVKGGNIESLISITAASMAAGQTFGGKKITRDFVADLVELNELEGLAKALEELLGSGTENEASTPS